MSAKLLAIDNNSDVRHLLEIRLKKAGYQVISADNVNDKFVQQAGGWNKMMVDTELKDHNFKSIARPDPIKHNMSVLDCCGQIVLPRTPRTPRTHSTPRQNSKAVGVDKSS